MLRPIVSVVIPVYNRPDALARALRSAVAQEGTTLEIVVVDDASNPPLVLPDDLAGDPRVHLVRQERNTGPAGARNSGISAACGEWIAFLDSDDIFLPGKLAAQLALADGLAPLTVIASGFHYDRATGSDSLLPIESADLADFCGGCWHCPGSTALISREAFARIGLFDPLLRRLEDLDWFIRLAQAGGSLRVAPHMGARINVGANATVVNVDGAAERIARKFLVETGAAAMPEAARQNLAAYLALERAAARFKVGRLYAAASFLGQSIWHRPRLRLHLRKWWTSLP